MNEIQAENISVLKKENQNAKTNNLMKPSLNEGGGGCVEGQIFL